MHASFQFTCVAYARSTGGTMRLLLAIDRGDAPLFDGEPVLLVEHRPGADAAALHLEGPDALDGAACELVLAALRTELAELVDGAFDRTGALQADRLLDRSLHAVLPHGTFDP